MQSQAKDMTPIGESGIWKRSAGELFPYIIVGQETRRGLRWGVQAPGGYMMICGSYSAAAASARLWKEQRLMRSYKPTLAITGDVVRIKDDPTGRHYLVIGPGDEPGTVQLRDAGQLRQDQIEWVYFDAEWARQHEEVTTSKV